MSTPGPGNVGRVVMDPVGRVLRAGRREALLESITPRDEHFVVAHLGVAHVPLDGWTLGVGGDVEQSLTLAFDELRAMPTREVTVALECAGNPTQPERPLRRVGNAVWRGVPMAALLEQARPRASARFAWLVGGDSGTYDGRAVDRYVKDVPIERALDPDTLIAYELNGEPLSAEHGFPARAVVPGFHGTCSVKWLSEVRLAAERHSGLFTTELYSREVVRDTGPVTEPVWGVRVNAVIVRPAAQAVLGREPIEVWGWAWADAEVAGVDVSFDGGETWQAAELEMPRRSRAWQRFGLWWTPPADGGYAIVARATDASGESQPDEPRLNQVHSVRVTVG